MREKRSALPSASSLLPPPSEDDSDVELRAELQQEFDLEQRKGKKRQRQSHSDRTRIRPTLRELLGLTDADDYIETRPAAYGTDSSVDPPIQSKTDEGRNRQDGKTLEPSDCSDSDEEPILSFGRKHAELADNVKTEEEEKDGSQRLRSQSHIFIGHDTCHSDSKAKDNDEVEFSLNVKDSLPQIFSSSPIAPSETDHEGDEEEIMLSTKAAPALALTSSSGKTSAGAVSEPEGQRPSFAIPAELLEVGPLVLAPGVAVPASINRFLRHYQRDGVRFLYRSYAENRGALLGDDMGLGKTIQVIAFLSAIMGKTGLESDADRRIEAVRNDRLLSSYHRANAVWPTCLIICPSSVIDNWRDELDTWGYFEHAAFTGAKAKDSLENFRRGRLDILVTSHETASMAIDQLSALDWSCILIDEAHKLKNPDSQMTRSMHRFACTARFALTGTAIQNSYRELYTLADWTNPGLLGSVKEWITEIEEPLKHGQKKDASEERLADARTRAEKLVKNVLPLFFLRRTKALIQDQLPKKFDNVVFCPLTSTQLDVYRRILAEPEVDLMKRHADPCKCGRLDPDTGLPFRRQYCCFKRGLDGEAWNKHMLKYIYLLQKCSNHVALVFPDPEDAVSKEPDQMERYQRQLSYVQLMFPHSWKDKRCNARNGMMEEYCGKWKVLSELLQKWHSDGDKVLLFSTNLRLLQFIAHFLDREGHSFVRLDGSTPQQKRQQLVNSFNRETSIFIFLISTTAGGTGLNLTAANKVVVFDPHWNPSHDLQAMDRAYRFGQTRDVHVFRLIGSGSLEECIYGRQLYKQQQMEIGYTAAKERRYFEGVAGDQDNLGELFGCKNLFTLHESSLAMKSIIDECNISDVAFALQRYLDAGTLDDPETVDAALADLANSERGSKLKSLDATATAHSKRDDDSIKTILDEAGIVYTHEHTSLTGGSKVEALRSREAQTHKRRAITAELPPSKQNQKQTSGSPTNVAAWPPPRPQAGPQSSSAAAAQEHLQDIERALAGSSRRLSARALTLEDLARSQNVSTAELAASIRAMSTVDQRKFFDQAVLKRTL